MRASIDTDAVLAIVTAERAVTDLRVYFGLDGGTPFSGAYFERLTGGGDRADAANRFTADDLVAVTMLSVSVPPGRAMDL